MVLESYAPGGQAGSSSLIENYFGFPTGINGGELTNRAQLQAFRFGAKFSIAANSSFSVSKTARGAETSAVPIRYGYRPRSRVATTGRAPAGGLRRGDGPQRRPLRLRRFVTVDAGAGDGYTASAVSVQRRDDQ